MSTPNTDSERGADLIAAERQRQIDAEGWTPEHDDEHTRCEMANAAIGYAMFALWQVMDPECSPDPGSPPAEAEWPWHPSWWKPSDDPIRNLVKAGALIAAEVDRLQRAQIDGSGVQP